ncbi:MAG: peptidase M19 [Sinimarinibacterium flocculans]|uniref:peptidase M19 n=1 Tax=Sinimarinibacterium flocculans TaxID=985250 RepID=UPI003C52ABF2
MMIQETCAPARTTRFGIPLLAATLASLVLAGCGNSSPAVTPPGDGGGNPTPTTLGRYDLFNQCWVMRADGDYVVRDGEGFAARDVGADDAERFYMRAANLARYLFYTPDGMLLTASDAGVAAVPQSAPEDGSDWTFSEAGDALNAATLDGVLAVADDGQLVLGSSPATLRFERATGCAEYPEMPLGVIGETFKGRVDAPALGFAEVHTHMAMGSEMSDGSRNVGPSAGGVMYGQAVNRFGVTEALKDCSALHGPDGITDPEALILDMTPGQTHDTQGWPSFVNWPFHDSMLHQQMYWRWVERAWMSGLRLMTIHGTNIEALCQVAQATGATRGQNPAEIECRDMPVGVQQVEYLYDIQDYIDAQFGGPGKGFFRIVESPAQARQVIADGKLAVVPGLEFSNLFGCNVTFLPDGSEIPMCSREQIDAEVERIWDLGVRQVFPYHDIDSALGGAGLFSASNVLEFFNFIGTGRFFETYNCEDGGNGDSYFYDAGLTSFPDPLMLGNDPLTDLLLGLTDGLTPTLRSGRQCNARDVTDLGIYAIDKLMKKGFVIDIDHAELRSKQIMLDHAAITQPAYPMVSGHGAQGGLTNAQARQLIAQGGIIYPINQNGKGHVDFLARLAEQWTQSGTGRPLSAGYGADANGLRTLPGPRGMARIMETGPVSYPFQMFEGEGWGPQFDGVAPITVELLAVPGAEGRIWDVNESGMYHYGMIADIVEEIRLEGGQAALDTLYNSAETYLQMWEQTLAASEDARTRPVPQAVPR